MLTKVSDCDGHRTRCNRIRHSSLLLTVEYSATNVQHTLVSVTFLGKYLSNEGKSNILHRLYIPPPSFSTQEKLCNSLASGVQNSSRQYLIKTNRRSKLAIKLYFSRSYKGERLNTQVWWFWTKTTEHAYAYITMLTRSNHKQSIRGTPQRSTSQ